MVLLKCHIIFSLIYLLLNDVLSINQQKFPRKIRNNNQNEVFVFGHQNPDTDSIVSALAYANFLRQKQVNAKAYRLGNLNRESKFVIEIAGINEPDMLPSDVANGTHVALVDHNESQQSMKNLDKMHVMYVIDHHKLGDLTTSHPIYLRFEPVGCTATIITKLYRENQLNMDEKTALLLVSGIFSDTLHFRSSTTTDEDRSMVEYLLPIAKIADVKSYVNQMFSAKSNLSGYSMEEILSLDYKTYVFNDQLWGIGVAESFYPNNIFERKDELIVAMNNEKRNKHLTGILFSIIDIEKEQNLMIVLDEPEKTVVQKAFNVSIQNGIADFGARISRKLHIVPPLERYLTTNYPNGSQFNSPLCFLSFLLPFLFLLTQYI